MTTTDHAVLLAKLNAVEKLMVEHRYAEAFTVVRQINRRLRETAKPIAGGVTWPATVRS